MHTHSFACDYTVYDSINELPLNTQLLIERAKEASLNAYAPYSNFHVGAAALLENNEIIIGSNQENAAYPSGLCAERVAVFAASTLYPGISIKSIAIVVRSQEISDFTISPCGGCRQVLFEYENKQNQDIQLYMLGNSGKVLHSTNVKNLLPLVFDGKGVKKHY
jgi:cytidine deaminase